MKASEKIKEMPLVKRAYYLQAVSDQIMDHQRRMDGGGGRAAAHFPFQMAPLINSHVIVLQALRAWGKDGHTSVC